MEGFATFKRKYPDDPHKLVQKKKKGFQFEEAEMTIANHKLEGEVVVLDWLPEEDVALLMNGAELFVFPSLYEGFGIPVLEAMSCGTPVVCSNTSSLPEVAGEAAIKFNPEKVDAIVKAIETVIFNPEIREALVAQGLAQAKKFSWQRTAEDTLKIINKVKLV